MPLPGVSVDEISLMKEKALASIAVSVSTEEETDSLVLDGKAGVRNRVVYQARKVSRGCRCSRI